MPERNRDQSLNNVLRQVLSADTPARADACLDGETVAGWTAGTLRADQAAGVERHLAHCSRCQALVAALVRTTPEPPAAEPIWRRWHLRWVVPLATAATAAAIWVATPRQSATVREADLTQAADQTAAATPEAAPAAPSERETAAVPSTVAPRERDASSREEKRAVSPPNRILALEDRAPAAPEAREEAVGLQKAEPSAAQFRAFAPSVPVIEITSPGEASRWRISNGQRVEWASPASADWRPASITNAGQLSAGASPSSTVCWLVGRGGAVFLTTDGSQFMRLPPFPEMLDLVSVTAVDDQNATVMSSDGRRWNTHDRGMTWTILQ